MTKGHKPGLRITKRKRTLLPVTSVQDPPTIGRPAPWVRTWINEVLEHIQGTIRAREKSTDVERSYCGDPVEIKLIRQLLVVRLGATAVPPLEL
jgi:hypothetical protein